MTTFAPQDLRVLITGGTGGIGAATARMLAQGGAHVMIADIDDDKGQALVRELGDRVRYRRLDVTQEGDWEAAVAEAEQAMGGVNALFNNAGIVSFQPVDKATPDNFRRTLDINLTGVFLGIRAVIPAMRRAGGGVIVNTSSTAGLMGYAGIAAYVASKWGVRGLTKASALDLAHDGIRVFSVHPGPIRTPMTDGLGDDSTVAQPIPRKGEPEEVAALVRYLFCEASFATGSEFVVDGGATIGQVLPLPEE